jgi:hypothetical protein
MDDVVLAAPDVDRAAPGVPVVPLIGIVEWSMPAMLDDVDPLPVVAPAADIGIVEWSMPAMLPVPGAAPSDVRPVEAGAPIPGIFEWSIPAIGAAVSPPIPGMFE